MAPYTKSNFVWATVDEAWRGGYAGTPFLRSQLNKRLDVALRSQAGIKYAYATHRRTLEKKHKKLQKMIQLADENGDYITFQRLSFDAALFRSYMNMCVPACRLPYAVFLRIFHYLGIPGQIDPSTSEPSSEIDLLGWRRCAHVCAAWSALVRNRPELWARSLGTIPQMTGTILKNAIKGVEPIVLTIYPPSAKGILKDGDTAEHERVLRRLAAMSSMWSELRRDVALVISSRLGSMDISIAPSSVEGCNTDVLKYAREFLMPTISVYGLSTESGRETFELELDFPLLTSASVQLISSNPETSSHGAPFGVAYSEMLKENVLRAPALRELTLRNYAMSWTSQVLERLSITFTDLSINDTEGISIADLLDALVSCGATLRHLELMGCLVEGSEKDQTQSDKQTIALRVVGLPNLRTLRIGADPNLAWELVRHLILPKDCEIAFLVSRTNIDPAEILHAHLTLSGKESGGIRRPASPIRALKIHENCVVVCVRNLELGSNGTQNSLFCYEERFRVELPWPKLGECLADSVPMLEHVEALAVSTSGNLLYSYAPSAPERCVTNQNVLYNAAKSQWIDILSAFTSVRTLWINIHESVAERSALTVANAMVAALAELSTMAEDPCAVLRSLKDLYVSSAPSCSREWSTRHRPGELLSIDVEWLCAGFKRRRKLESDIYTSALERLVLDKGVRWATEVLSDEEGILRRLSEEVEAVYGRVERGA